MVARFRATFHRPDGRLELLMIPESAQLDNAARLHKDKHPAMARLVREWRKTKTSAADILDRFGGDEKLQTALMQRGSSLRAAARYVVESVPKSATKKPAEAPEEKED